MRCHRGTIKQQKLNPVLCTLSHVAAFCNKKNNTGKNTGLTRTWVHTKNSMYGIENSMYGIKKSRGLAILVISQQHSWLLEVGRKHGAPYRGYGYVPLRFGGGGGRR